ncbi:MlaE family ABC transporter permease [Porphyromonas circumdentaria]|uniref:Phospholipid/cholesterol/gamma-HCH transport system permease protein n=1 Tax=Porphyromonas circumdentaria TaxID=29524 RepID=A0A1T4N7V2_9PORP|nr:ABC transporter permease [Porphyromonas circumdentaria]MBB6276055.1 phospholipid/cholesterol/gamma-HCH transport system permease protein [Porphyromonas circumdentaria]MDO4722444.1 ABC transporter permease [Porphyromonas circumdentaria]SJZ74908.1 phospholipid/cholesterol/gamma-HCH transport system permease protein [Porphyromonas circumdentaria]
MIDSKKILQPFNRALSDVGQYSMLMKQVFTRPVRWGIFFKSLIREILDMGLGSIWIVVIISFFIGSVITIQLAINMSSPFIPRFTIGYATREIVLLEFSSSIMCLILAGKIGSSIASELGTMRVTEQIDALEVMGINSANFLILPKITGLLLFIPILSIISMATAIGGGFLATFVTPSITASDFEYGMQLYFNAYNIVYSIVKSLVYAFIITSGASYFGYTVKGGALAVGHASTNAVVTSSVLILLADVLLTNLLLI